MKQNDTAKKSDSPKSVRVMETVYLFWFFFFLIFLCFLIILFNLREKECVCMCASLLDTDCLFVGKAALPQLALQKEEVT